jgi:outer membrane protein
MRRHRCLHGLTAAAATLAPFLPIAAGAQPADDASTGGPRAERTMTLAEAERAALEQQPQVLVARAATGSAEAQAEQARSPLLPQLTASASYTRQTGNYAPRPGALPTMTPGSLGWSLSPSRSYDYWSFGLAATQLIYDFGQTTERYHAARSTAEAQRAAERTARLVILSTVRRAYFGARATRDLVAVARESVDDQVRHLAQVQGFVEVGTQPPIALAQQRASLASARVQLVTATNNYQTAKAQLNQAAGLVGGTDFDVGDDELSPVDDEDQPLEALVAKALVARPEILVLKKQTQAQEDALSSVKGGYGPTLSAAAGASEAGSNLDNLVPNWTAGLVASWAVFQGGLTRGQVHQAEATLQGVDAQRKLEELQVRLDVDSARLAVTAAKATIGAANEAVASAREQLRLAEQRYATGVGGIIELTDAQVAYTTTAAQLVQARYGLSSARAQLLAALGRT